MKQTKIFTFLTLISMLTSMIFAQTDVPIPFEEEGFLYEYPDQSVLILDVGDNLFEVNDSLTITLTENTQLTDKKGKKKIALTELVPGSKVKVSGQRSRLNSTYTATKVQLIEPPKEFKVNGYFERLDKTSTGEVAWVSGQAVKLGQGVVIIGESEWKGKTFSSFNEMMLGSKVEMKVKMDPADKRFVVLEGKTKPNLYSFNDKKIKEAVQKQSAEYTQKLKISDLDMPITKPGVWELRDVETGQTVTGEVAQHNKPQTSNGQTSNGQTSNGQTPTNQDFDKLGVVVAGKQYELMPLPNYVEMVGNKLVPQYIRDLPDTDPGKINFKFFVAKDDTFNAYSLPDGTIVVHTGLLKMLRNESQLASILGHEISHITHEHLRRQMELKGPLFWVSTISTLATGINTSSFINLINLGFSRKLEDEADRVGLFYTANAGYDPRESPRVWKQLIDMKGKTSEFNNFFTSDHSVPEDRLKNLNKEIYRNYKTFDFGTTEKGEMNYLINVGTAFGWVVSTKKKDISPGKTAVPKNNQKPSQNQPTKKPVKPKSKRP